MIRMSTVLTGRRKATARADMNAGCQQTVQKAAKNAKVSN